MKAFLIVMLCSMALRFFACLLCLAHAEYPRTATYTKANDAFGLLWSLAFALWIAWLLWRPQ